MIASGVSILMACVVVGATPLDADEAVRRALARMPELANRRAEIALERARAGRIEIDPIRLRADHRAAEQVFGPRVDNNNVPYGPFDRTFYGVGVRPPALEELGLRQHVEGLEADALHEELERDTRLIAAEVRLLHAQLVLLTDEITILRDAVSQQERLRDAVAQKVAAQAATALDASATELDLLDLQLDIDEREAERARAEARLAYLTGSSDGVTPSGGTPGCSVVPSQEVALAAARGASPKLRRLQLREAALSGDRVRAVLRFVPWIKEINFGYFNRETVERDSMRAGVEVDVPVFAVLDGTGAELDVRAARLTAEQNEANQSIAASVERAVGRLKNARALVERHQASTAEVTKRSLEVVEAALASGGVDVMAASEVYSRALRSRRSLLSARQRCTEAQIALDEITGAVIPAP